MSTVLTLPTLPAVGRPLDAPDEAVRRQVWRLLAGIYPQGGVPERRLDQRFPYPHLIRLLPVGLEGTEPSGPPLVVVGKHLSAGGLGFYHQQPLAERRVIASLETHDRQWISLLVDVAWCRFSRHGWYDSGGRFLQVVPTPQAE
jgi:hypothetical protein